MNSAAITLPAWRRSTLAIALVGSFLMWASLPPLALGWLGWVAPVPWLVLVRMDELPGRRPYRALYLAGLVFWLMAIHWIRLPHPLTYLGWIALSGYLAVYLPAFVGLSRIAMQRLSAPLWLAAPVVWTGLELARAHLLTGFLMGSLAHTQVNWTQLIQIGDVVGEYGVDFVIMLTAACLATVVRISDCGLPIEYGDPQREIRTPKSTKLLSLIVLIPAVLVLSATLGYGHLRLAQVGRMQSDASHAAGPRVALIQGNSLAEWKFDSAKESQIMDDYIQISQEAIAKAREMGDGRPVDLVVWPETMFRTPLITFDPGYELPVAESRTKDVIGNYGPHDLAALVSRLNTPVLVGIDRIHYLASAAGNAQQPIVYNSAVLVGADGKIVATYDKVHRVMFGEYIPFAQWMPFLYRLTPLSGGIEPGAAPAALWLNNTYCFAPNICYETAIPHVIRRQIATLEDRSEYPNVLVNLTNDSWFWGSSELSMHLACDVFRAVETRTPLVVAANGGISAWIDRAGRIRAQSPRQRPDFILADIELGYMHSWYVQFGDWFSGGCLACCAALALVGWKSNRDWRTTTRQRNKETRR